MDTVINPERLATEPEIPPCGLLLPNPHEVQLFKRLSENRVRRHYLFNSSLYISETSHPDASFFVAGPAVGAPMAVLAMEKLIAMGGRRFLLYGWCGSLGNKLSQGDVLLPTRFKSEEGTSRHYPLTENPESAKPFRGQLAAYLQTRGIDTQEGPVWTTDAPYRETREKITSYFRKGILAVDMEYSALCTLAVFRKVELAAVLLVSDELYHRQWESGFGQKWFKQKSRDILHILIDFLAEGRQSPP